MNLKHLTDKALLGDIKKLAQEYRSITVELLHHLKEIDARKLYCELGYSSLFTYTVQELGFSESPASRRIDAMKMLKEIPEIEKKIETGDLTLSNIGKAANVFKKENVTDTNFKKEILKTIENTSARTCEKTLSEIIVPNKVPTPPPPIYYTITFNEENYKIFEQIRGILAHYNLSKDKIIQKILETALNKLVEKRFHTNSKQGPASSETRYIPPGLVKAVYERDKNCQKCGSSHGLELNHIIPFSLGGKTELSNLNLLCRNCNQRAAIESNLHFP